VNSQIQLTGLGMAGLAYDIQATTNLATANWITLGTSTADQNGIITFTDVTAPGVEQRFYRLYAQ
jgi:hypothetical protein